MGEQTASRRPNSKITQSGEGLCHLKTYSGDKWQAQMGHATLGGTDFVFHLKIYVKYCGNIGNIVAKYSL